MKILFSQLIALCFCTLLLSNSPLLVAQTATQTNNNLPPSFKYKLKKQVPVLRVDMPDELVQTTNRYREMGKPISPLHTVDTTFDFMKVAVCEKLPNGDKVWRLKIESNVMLQWLNFRNVVIPSGSLFYCYSENKEYYQYYQKDSWFYLINEKITYLEYYQPQKNKNKIQIIVNGLTLTYANSPIQREEQQNYGCIPNVRCNCADYNCPSPSSSVLTANELKNKISRSVVKLRFYKPNGYALSSN